MNSRVFDFQRNTLRGLFNSYPSIEMEQSTGCSAMAEDEIPDLIVIDSENNSPLRAEKIAKNENMVPESKGIAQSKLLG